MKRWMAAILVVLAVGLGWLLASRGEVETDGDMDALASLEGMTVRAVERVGPAVVKIATRTEQVFNTLFFGPIVQEREGVGSGVIIDTRGHVLTNNHVIAGATDIQVFLADRDETVPARVVGTDPFTDLAVLRIDIPDPPVAPLGDSDQLRAGQVVVAIGNPFGFENSVSLGLVSALGRGLRIDTTRGLQLEGLIQTDASINPGNSGGPLLNRRGEVVGITTAIIQEAQGIGFAIPINHARRVADQLINHGRVLRLGILGGTISPQVRQAYRELRGTDLPARRGVLVIEVLAGSPAEGHIQPGDIIVKANGKELAGMRELLDEVNQAGFGGRLRLTVIRGTEARDMVIVLE